MSNNPEETPVVEQKEEPKDEFLADLEAEMEHLPDRFKNPDAYQEPQQQAVHPLYRTSNSNYGSMKVSKVTMPLQYYGRAGNFTKQFTGFKSVATFNTSMTKSKV
ncbi:hypothetical protein PCE1_003979 [Barthelona sp. PCE]